MTHLYNILDTTIGVILGVMSVWIIDYMREQYKNKKYIQKIKKQDEERKKKNK